MEPCEGELSSLVEEMLGQCLGYAAPREMLRARRASQALLTRVEEALPGLPVNALDRDGATLLHLAAGLGHEGIARRVLERRADVAGEHRRFGTALHLCAERGQAELAQLLLDYRANVDMGITNTATTPLHAAAARGHVEVAHLLLDSQARADAANGAGAQPLHLAAAKGHADVTELLVVSRASVNVTSSDGTQPLHFAARQGHLKPVQFLLHSGAEIDVTDHAGHSPLSFASQESHMDVARMLLEHGAAVNGVVTSSNGALATVPLITAAERGHSELMKLLLDHRADLDSTDEDGLSAFHVAALTGHEAATRLLLRYAAMRSFMVPAATRAKATAMAQAGGHTAIAALLQDDKEDAELLS